MLCFPLSHWVWLALHTGDSAGEDRRGPGGHFSHLPCSAFPESSSIIVIWVFHVMGGLQWSRHKPHGEEDKLHILTKKRGEDLEGPTVLEIIGFTHLTYR